MKRKRKTSLIIALAVIFITTVLINIITTIEPNIIPYFLDFMTPLFTGTPKFIILLILLTINIIFGYYPVISFFSIGGRKWIIKQYLPSIFNALFKTRLQRLLKEKPSAISSSIYRVTCFRYQSRKKHRVNFWYQYFYRKIFRKSKWVKQRVLDKDKGYLLCYARYGLENGKFTSNNSSLSYQVTDENLELLNENNIKGIAGLTYINDNNIKYSINNIKINETLDIIIKNAKDQNIYDSEIAIINNCNILNSIQKLKNTINILNSSKEVIDESMQKELFDFIKNTNTDFRDLFGISNGFHSNHFLGFKLFDEYGDIWGVIVIDIYENVASNFWKIVSPDYSADINEEVCKEWINCILSSFSNLMSETIINLILRTEENDGKGIRN